MVFRVGDRIRMRDLSEEVREMNDGQELVGEVTHVWDCCGRPGHRLSVVWFFPDSTVGENCEAAEVELLATPPPG